MKTLLLVDGSSYLYRAFHALPDLRTAGGEPTGAVRGFVSMMRILAEIVPHEYGACVFDAPGKTFRDELFPDYKAHRPPMPPDLVAQIPLVHESVQALGWPLLQVAGVEADDVIGTLACDGARRGLATVISTGDKDLAQLVDADVTLIDTMSRDGGPPRRYDRQGVIDRFGVPPERIVDYLALVGDTADNIPGVDKVGPKTAVKWLQQFGSLEGVMAHAAEIPGVVGARLREAIDWLPTARQLVVIRTDVALDLAGDEALARRPPDLDRLRALYERCEFRSWLRELPPSPAASADWRPPSPEASAGFRPPSPTAGVAPSLPGPQGAAGASPPKPEDPAGTAPPDPTAKAGMFAQPEVHYETVLTEEQLDAWLGRIEAAELTCIDTETTSLDPMRAQLVGISLSVEPFAACYIPLAHRGPAAPPQLGRERVLARLAPWLQDERQRKVGQHLKYDSHVFANHGLRLAGIEHDTLLQSYVLEAHKPHDMDSLAARHLGRDTITYEQVCGKGARQIGFDEVEVGRATAYAAEDAEVTLALHRALWPRVQAEAGLAYVYRSMELPVAQVLFTMERNGVLIDPARLAAHSAELALRIAGLEQRAHELAGQPFNLGSPKQVGEILFGKLGLPAVKKTASGAASTDEEVLEKLAQDYPLPKALLEHRALSKLRSTYCEKLPAMVQPGTGRVHTSYGQAIAITGRLASSEPNLQNIPVRTPEGRRIREAFIAPPGSHILSADYSQIELRIMAHISGDAGLRAAFAQGEDVHRATAAEVFGVAPEAVDNDQRRTAKVINFGLIYGMTSFGLAANLGIGKEAARLYIDRYFARYPGVARYMEQTRAGARRQGYVETVFGRRLWLPEINSPNGPRRQAAERAAINAPMQGTAADLIKLAMIAVQDWLRAQGLRTLLVMQVHDELVFEVPDAELEQVRAAVPGLMTGVGRLEVPLEVGLGVGGNWDQAH